MKPDEASEDSPLLIVFPYGDSSATDPSHLAIWVYADGRWQFVGGEVDAEAHTVFARVTRPGRYALVAGVAARALPDTGSRDRGAPEERDGGALLAALIAVAGIIVLGGWSMRRVAR